MIVDPIELRFLTRLLNLFKSQFLKLKKNLHIQKVPTKVEFKIHLL